MSKILVAGAGGFIGSHLVTTLRAQGHFVRGVDIKQPEFSKSDANEFCLVDLRSDYGALSVMQDMDDVYQLAADMGGIGYITAHHASIAHNNTLINLRMLEAAKLHNIRRYLYTSSACVYNQNKQRSNFNTGLTALKEEDAYPALPEPGYGWEKLYAEQMTQYYIEDYGLNARIVRFHNVYGPLGTYDGGKEKSPAALCRKIAKAKGDGDVVEIWGDGKAVRSYMYIDDCVEGLLRIMDSGYNKPVNLGTEEAVEVNDLAAKIARIANKNVRFLHVYGPEGVRGRNSNNRLLRGLLDWEPLTPLDRGLVPTYRWINQQVNG